MDAIGIDVRYLVYIESQTLEDNLRIEDESAGTKLGAWITCFFQDQDTGRESRKIPRKMKCGREAGGSSANDEDIVL